MRVANNKGQSTIEFILTFTAAVGFIFLFLKMAMNYTNGYMVHHAVYMASRSYLVGDSESQQTIEGRDKNAFELATAVFKKNLPEPLIQGFDGVLMENNPGSVKFSVFTGVYIDFTQLFSISFVGGKDPVKFRSESFLGREPTRVESAKQVCEAIKTVTLVSCDFQATLDDNGG
ncbi:MAG: hypothetical protein WC635_08710 [Bacteriovorax sp.]|jgi:hypothetical protein